MMIKCSADSARIMLAAELPKPFQLRCSAEARAVADSPQQDLAPPRKTGYSYPTIWLPYTFAPLAALPTRKYQTVRKGRLAFFVVVSLLALQKKELHEIESLRLRVPAMLELRAAWP
jgi:hypothetical protein